MTRAARDAEAGSAVVEFVFVAIVVMIPLLYLVITVAAIQRGSIAVTSAARAAGRAFATAESTSEGLARAKVAVALAMRDQGLDPSPELRFVPGRASCAAAAVLPALRPGTEFTVCVRYTVRAPGVPSVLAGASVRTVGQYVVHVDDFRTVRAR